MADIRRVKLPNGTTYNIKDNTARSSITNITNGTTKLPYGKSLSITNTNKLNLLDPNSKILSTVNIPIAFKHAHFEYLDAPMNMCSIVIDEYEALSVNDLVYIKQIPESALIPTTVNTLFYKSNYEGHIFYINSGINKVDAFNSYVYSISTIYDYIVKVIDARGNGLYDFEIIAGGPKDSLMQTKFLSQQAQPDLIPALGQTTLLFNTDTEDTAKYLELYDANENLVFPSKESIGILANGKVILQYTCNAEVVKIKTKAVYLNSYTPNYVIGFAYDGNYYTKKGCHIVYINNNGTAEGSFVGDSLQTVYDVGASSWDLIFVCDYAYPNM